MNLFCVGDILQMRDNSQWEVFHMFYEPMLGEYCYEIRSLVNDNVRMETEWELNRVAIVLKFAHSLPKERSKGAKVYHMEDYRNRRA